MKEERTAMDTAPGTPSELEPARTRAVGGLTGMIRARYPGTRFRVRPGVDDPETTYLVATVDIDDPDEVLDLVMDRLVRLQGEDRLPISVLPIHTPERVARTMHQAAAARPPGAAPLPSLAR
jgi:hypothetical protein